MKSSHRYFNFTDIIVPTCCFRFYSSGSAQPGLLQGSNAIALPSPSEPWAKVLVLKFSTLTEAINNNNNNDVYAYGDAKWRYNTCP
eukprot:SAG31_NODE_1922_length_6916_cov_3.724219_5_plen_86_part_00